MKRLPTFLWILALAVVVVRPAAAATDDRPLAGAQLVLSRSNSGKEKLVFQAKDPALSGPAAGSSDDPSQAGVSIEFYSAADGIVAPLTIPPASTSAPGEWDTTGPSDFKFVHAAAPGAPTAVRSFQLRSTKKLKVVAKDVPLALTGTNGVVTVRVRMGAVRYCARFSGTSIHKDQSGKFRAKALLPIGFTDCSNGGLGMQTPILPTATQACPTLVNGNQTILGKSVKLWIGADAGTLDGPFVFVWHGAGGNPDSMVAYLLANGQLQQILDQGGIVAGFQGDGNTIEFGGGFLGPADELLACAHQQFGVDPRRIHSTGFSAGGLMTTVMSTMRSNYIASVSAYSGGFTNTVQDPNNKYAALVVHGGPTDIVIVQFEPLSIAYYNQLVAAGHFAILCNHNSGHNVPTIFRSTLGLQFMFDHPYGTDMSPYAGGLPVGYPGYCTASQ